MRGITIIELVVTMVMVSIMMAGILASNYAIQRMDRNISKQSVLFLRSVAIVDNIAVDASNAIGSLNNMGVCLSNISTQNNYFCFRQSAGWVCYTRLNVAGNNAGHLLYRCTKADTSALTGGDPTACAAAGQGPCTIANTLQGAIAEDVFTGAGVWPSFNKSGFTMPYINRPDPTAANSADNPDVKLWVAAYAEGHSF